MNSIQTKHNSVESVNHSIDRIRVALSTLNTPNKQTGRHGYTDNATSIGGKIPAPSNRVADDPHDDRETSRWTTLNEANRDFKAIGDLDDPETGDVKEEQRESDIVNDVQSWGERVGLTELEIKRATRYIIDADGDWIENTTYDAIILGALTVVANEGPPEFGGVHKIIRPNRPLPNEEVIETLETHGEYVKREGMVSSYSEIKDSLDVSDSLVRRARSHLR